MSGIKPAGRHAAAPPTQRQKRRLTGGTTRQAGQRRRATGVLDADNPGWLTPASRCRFSFAELWAAPPFAAGSAQTLPPAMASGWRIAPICRRARCYACGVPTTVPDCTAAPAISISAASWAENTALRYSCPICAATADRAVRVATRRTPMRIWRDVASMLELVRSQFRGVPLSRWPFPAVL